ncbi:60S ribosomal protein L29 [Mortierella sp. AD010]|nr:60S ribosomal protein L29 [Mortierella sp. AD010]
MALSSISKVTHFATSLVLALAQAQRIINMASKYASIGVVDYINLGLIISTSNTLVACMYITGDFSAAPEEYAMEEEALAELVKMAKSKNHTNHNQNKKAHRNGIKKVKTQRHPSLKGVCPKFLRNQRFAKKGSAAALKKD